jgi:hypothetical protein
VVGAPMFKKDTENFDIGRVYVYLRHKNKKNFEFSRLVLNGYRAKSRFGTTLAKIGDVNDDGFQGNSSINSKENRIKSLSNK